MSDQDPAQILRPASPPRYGHEVRWDVRIPVRDGLELSANLWLPRPANDAAGALDGADAADADPPRFPAILEMIPYGKDSWRRNADVARGEWLAARPPRAARHPPASWALTAPQ